MMDAEEENDYHMISSHDGDECDGGGDNHINNNNNNSHKKSNNNDKILASSTTNNNQLFIKQLNQFLSKRGKVLKIPTLGHKELDLEQLYLEVTNRGGVQNVIENKWWHNIVRALKLPSTCTNAAYALRVHYNKLLKDYEEENFMKNTSFNNKQQNKRCSHESQVHNRGRKKRRNSTSTTRRILRTDDSETDESDEDGDSCQESDEDVGEEDTSNDEEEGEVSEDDDVYDEEGIGEEMIHDSSPFTHKEKFSDVGIREVPSLMNISKKGQHQKQSHTSAHSPTERNTTPLPPSSSIHQMTNHNPVTAAGVTSNITSEHEVAATQMFSLSSSSVKRNRTSQPSILQNNNNNNRRSSPTAPTASGIKKQARRQRNIQKLNNNNNSDSSNKRRQKKERKNSNSTTRRKRSKQQQQFYSYQYHINGVVSVTVDEAFEDEFELDEYLVCMNHNSEQPTNVSINMDDDDEDDDETMIDENEEIVIVSDEFMQQQQQQDQEINNSPPFYKFNKSNCTILTSATPLPPLSSLRNNNRGRALFLPSSSSTDSYGSGDGEVSFINQIIPPLLSTQTYYYDKCSNSSSENDENPIGGRLKKSSGHSSSSSEYSTVQSEYNEDQQENHQKRLQQIKENDSSSLNNKNSDITWKRYLESLCLEDLKRLRRYFNINTVTNSSEREDLLSAMVEHFESSEQRALKEFQQMIGISV